MAGIPLSINTHSSPSALSLLRCSHFCLEFCSLTTERHQGRLDEAARCSANSCNRSQRYHSRSRNPQIKRHSSDGSGISTPIVDVSAWRVWHRRSAVVSTSRMAFRNPGWNKKCLAGDHPALQSWTSLHIVAHGPGEPGQNSPEGDRLPPPPSQMTQKII